MARLLKSDGTEETRSPAGSRWTLAELQEAVGGYIELMPGVKPLRIVMNEEGNIRNLPVNAAATALVLDALKGQALRYVPQIVGDVLVLEPGERM